MKRFAARVVPIAMLAGAGVAWDRDSRAARHWLEWRAHTFEARSLAERLARDACASMDVDRIPADIDAFAEATDDNAAQVAVAASLRSAFAASDFDEVRRLADVAIAEEQRLLPIREGAASSKLESSRAWGRFLWAFGFCVAIFQAGLDWVIRALRPTLEQVMADRDAKDRALQVVSRQKAEAVDLSHDLRLQIAMLEEQLAGERFNSGWREVVAGMRATIAESDRKGVADDRGHPL